MTGEANEADKLAQQIGQMEGAGRVSTVVTRGAVTTCGCTLEPGSGRRTYCEKHDPMKTAKGQAIEALMRVSNMATAPVIAGLDVVTLRGYVQYAIEKVTAIEELKKARPVRKA